MKLIRKSFGSIGESIAEADQPEGSGSASGAGVAESSGRRGVEPPASERRTAGQRGSRDVPRRRAGGLGISEDIPRRLDQPPPRNPLWFGVCSLASGVLPWLALFIAYRAGAEPDSGKAELVQTVFLLGSIVAIVSAVIALKRSKSPFHRKADRLRKSIASAAAWLGLLLGGAALFLQFAAWDQSL